MRWAMKLSRATPRALQDYHRRGMIMRVMPLSSVLLQAAVVSVFCGSSTATNIRYTNSWAVEVRNGGSKAADALARKYGFENRGQVGLTSDILFTGIRFTRHVTGWKFGGHLPLCSSHAELYCSEKTHRRFLQPSHPHGAEWKKRECTPSTYW